MSEHSEYGQHHGPRWGRILGIGAVLLILVLVVGHWIWSAGTASSLRRQVAAYKAAGEPIEPGDFVVTGVADADNAVLDIEKAIAAIVKSESLTKYDQLIDEPGFPLRDVEIDLLRAISAENAAVYPHIERAMTKRGVDWKLNLGGGAPMMQVLLPHLNHQRNLARVVAVDLMLAHHEGDDVRAMKRLEQILYIGRVNDGQPTLVSHLVSIGITALGCDRAMLVMPELRVGEDGKSAPRADVEAIIRQLLDDEAQGEGQRMALLGERAMQLDTVRMLQSGRLSLSQLAGPGGPGNAAQAVAAAVAVYALKPTFNSDGLLMIRTTTALLNAAQQSPDYPTFQATKPAFPIGPTAKPWQNVLARLMMPSLDRAVQTDFRSMTDRRLAGTALAIRLYALDHGGKLPETLSALLPKYLPAVPLDPLAAGKPIGYIADPGRPIVYSVGENGADDGGSDKPMRPGMINTGRWQQMDAVFDLTRQPRSEPQELDDGVGGLSTQPATEPAPEP